MKKILLILVLMPVSVIVYPNGPASIVQVGGTVPEELSLEVSSDWGLAPGVFEYTIPYNVSCNVRNMVIGVELIEELPGGIQVMLNANSTIGVSSGWVTLEKGESHILVYHPMGTESSTIEMRIVKLPETEFSSIQIELDFVWVN